MITDRDKIDSRAFEHLKMIISIVKLLRKMHPSQKRQRCMQRILINLDDAILNTLQERNNNECKASTFDSFRKSDANTEWWKGRPACRQPVASARTLLLLLLRYDAEESKRKVRKRYQRHLPSLLSATQYRQIPHFLSSKKTKQNKPSIFRIALTIF